MTPEQLERLAERKLDDELADLRSSEAQKQRRVKKKEARKRAKLRERVALGMDQAGTSVDVEQEGVFSLAASKDVTKKALQVRSAACCVAPLALLSLSSAHEYCR